MVKECSVCRVVLPLEAFNRQKQGRFGVRSSCRECQRAYNAAYREANAEKHRAANRAYRHAHPEKRAEGERRRRAADPVAHNERVRASRRKHYDRHLARKAVWKAVRNGKLVRPQECPVCGCSDRPVHAHHKDYADRLNVIWLCSRCHGVEHRDMVVAA